MSAKKPSAEKAQEEIHAQIKRQRREYARFYQESKLKMQKVEFELLRMDIHRQAELGNLALIDHDLVLIKETLAEILRLTKEETERG